MKAFEFYIAKGYVKKRSKDPELAESLSKDSKSRLDFLRRFEADEQSSKFILENSYDAVRELIEAKLAVEGYKSYSHEGTISYLKNIDHIGDSEIHYLDILRKMRNDSKYYGKSIEIIDAKKAFNFAVSFIKKFEK